MTIALWGTFLVLLAVDIFVSVLRVSLLNTRMPLLIGLRDRYPRAVERSIALLGRPRYRVSLAIVVVIVHYMVLGLGIWLYRSYFQTPALLPGLLLIVLAGYLLLMLEYAVQGAFLPRAELWAVRLSGFAQWIDGLLAPFSSLLMSLLGSPHLLEQRLSPVTEDELKSWVEEGQPEGVLEQGERRMIASIFHFGDTLAREVMVPRIDILALDVTTSLDVAVQVLTRSGHSRVPIYEDSIDNVLGLLYAKDLLRSRLDGQNISSLRSLMRPAYFVPEAKKVDELLREMQARSFHMAMVVDEYGGIAGLVTLEDIVEEIVGEIRDEYDQGEERNFEQITPDEYLFHGRIDLDDFNTVMGTSLTREQADTLGGYIYSRLGRVPTGGEEIPLDSVLLTIVQVSGRRIRRVRAQRNHAAAIPGGAEEGQDESNHK